MTDRYDTFTVVLERPTRDDDAEPILTAIRMIRGVMQVVPHVAGHESYAAEERARRELGTKLLSVLYPKKE